MRFWDASAITPILIDEEQTGAMLELLKGDAGVAVWWGTSIECASSLRRRERTQESDASAIHRAFERLVALAENWSEVQPGAALRAEAERNLAVHPLRAGDALQLAAAVTWRGDLMARREFVCLDERLRDAAQREGFALLPAA